MKLRWLVAALWAGSLAVAAPAEAADLVLEPSSKWTLDYAEDSCALRRQFGTEENLVQLEIRYFSNPMTAAQITFASNKLPPTRRVFRFRLEPDGDWHKIERPMFASYDDGFDGTFFEEELYPVPEKAEAVPFAPTQIAAWKAERDEMLGTVTGVTVERAFFGGEVTLQTGPLVTALAAIDACLEDLRSSWGIDVARAATMSRSATPINQAEVARLIKYPSEDGRGRQAALVRVRMAVDENGNSTECHIQLNLGDPAFERETCKALIANLKFEPALDSEGRPMADVWLTSVHFEPYRRR